MKKKLALNFLETSDSDLHTLASRVAMCMTDNEHFSDPGMLIIELKETNAQYIKALTDSGLGDRHKVAMKNDLRAILIKKLKQIAELVQNEANGEQLPLISSGFPTTKPSGEIVLKEPVDFQIMPGPQPGDMILKVRRVIGARSYLYQWTPAPLTSGSVWESVADTRCKRVITGLPLGINYLFRMAAVGAHNQIIYTTPLSRYIS
jgi:hypothetical protein